MYHNTKLTNTMSGFISALIKQRRDAKKARPDTNGRLKEIINIIRKQNYDDGITPAVIINILQDLGRTYTFLFPAYARRGCRIGFF